MKLIFTTLIVFLAATFEATAFAYPPSQPKTQYYTNCRLEFTGIYYYVTRNGQRFTELTSNLQKALDLQNQLQNSGMCEYTYQSPGSCQLEFTGSYYYVSRNGSCFSELVSNYRSALNTRDMFYQSGNCDENTYRPSQLCKIEFTGSYYYVSRNGSRFSELASNINQAVATRDDFARNYVCQIQYQNQSCRLEFTGSYYYISINTQRASELFSDLNQVINQQSLFAQRGMCSIPYPERCTIEFSGSYYYVGRNGSRLSSLVSSISQADNMLQQLRYSRNCY